MNNHRPNWFALNMLMITLLVGLFIVHQRIALLGLRQVLEIAVVVGGFVLIGLWLHANAAAIEAEDARRKKEARSASERSYRPSLTATQRRYLQANRQERPSGSQESPP